MERLKEAKDATGLSFAALAASTAYSKSSWERYLNGKAFPPRGAVEALARLGGTDPAGLLALWRLADGAWSGRDARRPADPPRVTKAEPEAETEAKAAPGPEPRPGTQTPAVAGPKPGAGHEDASDGQPARGSADHECAGPGLQAAPARGPGRRAVAVAVVATVAVMAAVFGVATWVRAAADGGAEPPAGTRSPVPCRGKTCTDHDSEQGETACWTDAATHAVRTVRGRTVELRHSPVCAAVWGRIRDPLPADRVWVETSDGRRQSRQVSVPGRSLYTLMIGVERPADARTCFELGDGDSGCTGPHR
ncbi:helix-turn-helix domain-containing protein [Streptomyces fructofermentans]|uniref:helix-turn-helix domain-containing protein n=1 Tax=Streptomyces fructofermentans TaxID=152141 RepID=UPI00167A3D7E|nr:XRE family transcriptional regulator [Streptomyces fructofermentans]